MKNIILFIVFILCILIFIFYSKDDHYSAVKHHAQIDNLSSSGDVSNHNFSANSSLAKQKFEQRFEARSQPSDGLKLFQEITIIDSEKEKEICAMIFCEKNINFKYIKIDRKILNEKEAGDIFSVEVPGQVDVDVYVSSMEIVDGGKSLVGHLSGYSESYYFGLVVGDNGDAYGQITTEKSNYAIRTYLGQTVVFEVIPDLERFKENDY